MAFQINQIDAISDFDEAMEVLEMEYIPTLIDQFQNSPEGKAYIEAHPEAAEFVGEWVGHFLLTGYGDLEATLPGMTEQKVKKILLEVFPRKLSLLDPEDANSTIPELIAFWEFVQREYKLRHSKKILALLHKLQPTFPETMNDPQNFGVAKSFLMAGQAAGFDMTSQEGIEAFQQQYNQQIQETDTPPPGFPALPRPQATGTGQNDALQDLQDRAWQHQLAKDSRMEVTEEAIALLQQLTITETIPGTIVKDFQTLLDALGDRGIPVSGKLQHFAMQSLRDLNEHLSHPIQLDLKRPQQKSYPNLHGLYLLLRSTGLAELGSEGKTVYLRRNPELYEVWQALNPTEQYFNLLEAWLIRGDAEILGEIRNSSQDGMQALRSWPQLKLKDHTYKTYQDQSLLNYWPGLHNVALLQMFGWVELTAEKPEAGKGWRIGKVTPLPVGDAIATVAFSAYLDNGMEWVAANNFTQPWGELQPYFHPYFPEWEHNLPSPQIPEPQTGTYIFRVSLGKIWRRLAISSEATLDVLGGLILESVNFDSDHLDMFSYKHPNGRTVKVYHPYSDWVDGPTTDEVNLGELPLKPGMTMTYLFDFGDNWTFELLLEDIQPGKPKHKSGKILEQHGKAPEQYPSWDEF